MTCRRTGSNGFSTVARGYKPAAQTATRKVEYVLDQLCHARNAPLYMLGDLSCFFGVTHQHTCARSNGGQRTSKIVPEHRDELLPQFGSLPVARQFFLLSKLSYGDVDGGSDHTLASAGLVEHATALGGNPADNAILLADRAVFHVVEPRRAGSAAAA